MEFISFLAACIVGPPLALGARRLWIRAPHLRRPMTILGGLGGTLFLALLAFGVWRMVLDTPVADAARAGDVQALGRALEAGGSPDAGAGDDGQWPALLGAIEGGSKACVELLLERGADPNVASGLGTPLERARERGRTDLMRILKRYGAR